MEAASASDGDRGPNSRGRSRAHARTGGQAVVEFALLVPMLLAMVALGLDAGRMFFSWIEVVNGAREGAAFAAGNPTDTAGISTRVSQEANVQAQGGEGGFVVTTVCRAPGGASISCASAAGGDGTGNTVTVTVSRTFGFITPVVSNVLGSSFAVRGSATAAVFGLLPYGGENQPNECNDPRKAQFTVSSANLTVTLDATASAPNSGRCAISSYEWDMGDGADPFPPVVGMQTTYTYAAPGTYTITLVTRNPGGSETATQNVSVPAAPPTVSPSPSPTPTPTPVPTPPPDPACTMVAMFSYTEQGNSSKYNFYGAYTGQPAPNTWYWTYGDGDVGWGQAPSSHTFSGSGPYTVTLTITNGSCSASTSQSLVP